MTPWPVAWERARRGVASRRWADLMCLASSRFGKLEDIGQKTDSGSYTFAMTKPDSIWIAKQLKAIDLMHEPKSLDTYGDCATILVEAARRFKAYPAAVAACKIRELVNPDAARIALAVCLAAIKQVAEQPTELTLPEAAKRLGCKPATIIAMIRSGRLRAKNLGQKTRPRYRIAIADLEAMGKVTEMPARLGKVVGPNPRD
jgi:excisionase family DNA binding protein